jgi:hypothetical protein
MAELTEAQKREIERLRSEHPDYAISKERWDFYLRSYEGGPDYVSDDTLHKHQREHQEDFQDRLDRAVYANYCQPLVDFVPEFIYSQGVNRKPPKNLEQVFDNFKLNVDRAGTALDPFMESTAEEARIFGHTWVGIDKMPKPENEGEISDARAEALGIKVPYLYHVRPLEVLDWITDRFGNYIYLKRKDIYWEKVGARGRFRRIERYTEWELETVTISKIDITEEGQEKLLPKKKQENVWKLIPFVQFFYKRSKFKKDIGVSFLNDIAYQNNYVFNLTSYLGEFLARQCFNILSMEQDTSVPTRDRADGRVGTSNVLWIPKNATHKPEYITPPVDPAEFVQSERSNAIKEMYRQAAQDIMAEVFAGGDVPSADAQKQAFARTIPMIAKMADSMQFGEISLWTIWAQMQGKLWEGGSIAYRDDYSVTNVQDLLLQLTTIFNNLKVLSPTFIREEWIRIINEFDGKIPPDTMTKIKDEIAAMSDDEITEPYKMMAGDNKAVGGVPSTANLTQGRNQKGKTDRQISMATGNKASTKEANPDANRRASSGRSAKR